MSDITEGKDGFLFLTGGSNKVAKLYARSNKNRAWVSQWASLLKQRHQKVAELGARYYHISAPEKVAIYYDKLPLSWQFKLSRKHSPGRLLAESDAGTYVVSPETELRARKSKHLVYSKTDSHWNVYGAYSAYASLMQKLGKASEPRLLENLPTPGKCVMDLAGKLESPEPEEVIFYQASPNVVRAYANEMVQYKEQAERVNDVGLHVGSIVEYHNAQATNPESILLFGSSFSEYRPHLVTGMLAESFAKVRFVWGINLDYAEVEAFSPDIVLTETAERFLPSGAPNDQLSYTEFVESKMKELK